MLCWKRRGMVLLYQLKEGGCLLLLLFQRNRELWFIQALRPRHTPFPSSYTSSSTSSYVRVKTSSFFLFSFCFFFFTLRFLVLAWHTLPSVRRQSRFLNNSHRRLFGEGVSRGEEGGGTGGGGGEGELGGQCVVWNAPGRPRCCQYIDILFWLKRASQGPLLHTNTNSPSRRFLLLRALTGRSTLEIVELHFIWAATASHSASSRPRLLINEYIGALKSRVSPHHHPLNPYPPPPPSHPLSLSLSLLLLLLHFLLLTL